MQFSVAAPPWPRAARWAAAALALALVPATGVAQARPLSAADTLVQLLPDSLRATGTSYFTAADSLGRLTAVYQLSASGDSAALTFIAAVARIEPSAYIRSLIVGSWMIGARRRPAIATHPGIWATLRWLVAHDADSGVVAEALHQMRALNAVPAVALIHARMTALRTAGCPLPAWLLAEERRALDLSYGYALPAFMREPPPVFAAAPPDQTVRVFAFGDWGNGSANQRAVAAAMREYHARHPFTFGITLGDNFYPRGVASPADPRWRTQYEALYSPMGVPIYATLGNHDQYDGDSPAAEYVYGKMSPTWRLPALYYTFRAGPAQFFAVDGNALSAAELAWLKRELDRSTARWKIVYGHYPVASAMTTTPADMALMPDLEQVLAGRADVYVAGHSHNLQHLAARGGVALFVVGGGGAHLYAVDSTRTDAKFARSVPGFAVLDIDARTLRLRFVGRGAKVLYETTLTK